MRIFAIKDEELSVQTTLAYLLYYEKPRAFYIELPDTADPWETPLLLSSFLKKGERTINAYWSMVWVRQRIIPQDRQNLGVVLKENKLDEYDEFELLMLADGRCAQDSCYLAEITESELPDELIRRWEKKVEDVVPASDRNLLVFFRNGAVKKCCVQSLVGDTPAFAPILRHESRFCAVSVQPDGYGVSWSEQAVISHLELYDHGMDIPLSMDDFLSFIANRVINAGEAAEMLNCSRQNINDLVRRGKLNPIRTDSKNKLFMKNEVQQRIQK